MSVCGCGGGCVAGDVVTEETYNKCIKPEGHFNGKKVGPKDVIHLKTGGTGFAARDGDKAQVKKHFSLGESRQTGWLGSCLLLLGDARAVSEPFCRGDEPGSVVGVASAMGSCLGGGGA